MRRIVIVVVLALTRFAFLAQAHAQQTQTLPWSGSDGNQSIEVGRNEIHFLSTDPKSPTRNITTPLHLPSDRPWQIKFEVQMIPAAGAGMGVHLVQSNKDIAWLGAGDYYKYLSAFLSSDNSNMPYDEPWNTEWHRFEYDSDGKVLSLWHNGKKYGEVPLPGTPDTLRIESSGIDLRVRGVQVNGELVQQQSIKPELEDKRPSLITVYDDEQNICCLAGDIIHLAGHYSSDRKLIERFLDTGNTWQFQSDINSKSDDYAYNWKAPNPGTYHLNAGYTSVDNQHFYARACTVTVLSAPPLMTDLPQSAVSDVIVSSHAAAPSVFHADNITFQFDGRSIESNGLQVKLPVGSLPNGNYPFTYEAIDNHRGRFVGNTTTLYVPERIQVSAPPNFTLAKSTDRLPLAITLSPGVTLSNVTYSCDGQPIATANKDPYNGAANLSAFASGNHSIEAVAVASDGNQYHTASVSINLTNLPQDKQKADAAAALAKQQAQAQAEADARAARQADKKKQAAEDARVAAEMKANVDSGFRPRAGYDEAIFRQQIMAYTYNPMQLRTGKVGTVRGLSVYVENDEPKYGLPNTIEAIVRPGTGQTNFLAFSEDDSRVAAQTAAEVCKNQTLQMGYKWDWSKYDLTVSYQENDVKHGGPSAGVADAVALMSAVLNMPVDSSVAVTGAISLHGDVLPVGGVDFKADAALNDPNIKILIVPDHIASTSDLVEVYDLEPKVFFNKHIILAKDIDTVFKYALIGWNLPVHDKVQRLMQEAIRQFGKSQDAEALHLFGMAKSLAPEDIGINYWINLVKTVDAMNQLRKQRRVEYIIKAQNAAVVETPTTAKLAIHVHAR